MHLPRRQLLIGAAVAGAVPLAGCAKPDQTDQAGQAGQSPPIGQPLAPTADVPEGGGIIVKETVLTQPRPGEFKGFVARCTHSGCLLAEVKNGSIVCACHGSRFDLNGQVTRGPATAPLTVRAVTVREGEIVAE
ncbi:MAG: Rieske (2Fe-2S) protein [Mycobacterium sp.]|nr:Rieske (2Fe-2S) protein [Mycobacterium sp.]